MNSNQNNAYWILLLALLGAALGYQIGLGDRPNILQEQEQIERYKQP